MSRVVALALVAACYRGEAPAPMNANALEQACSSDDDLRRPVIDNGDGRLRMHRIAPLAKRRGHAAIKLWVGPKVPAYIPQTVETLQLLLLDEVDGGYLALYRDLYNTGSCALGTSTNCAFEARRYRDGKVEWSISLDRFFSRPDQLELQDIRLSGDILYFNEACQSYSGGAGGDCSSLVALDPRARRVVWRTPPLTSNSRFAVRGCYIVAGYGFTAEPDSVFLVDRANGKVLQQVPVASAPTMYKLGPAQVDVTLYSGMVRHYRLDNPARRGSKLVALEGDPTEFGGGAYGGGIYGGGIYGGGVYGGLGYGP